MTNLMVLVSVDFWWPLSSERYYVTRQTLQVTTTSPCNLHCWILSARKMMIKRTHAIKLDRQTDRQTDRHTHTHTHNTHTDGMEFNAHIIIL